MPYIEEARKDLITYEGMSAETPGELNYLLTLVILDYLRENKLCYRTINDITGALVCCQQEFQRRVTNKYEDSKIKSNGDVYPEEFE